MSLMQRVLNTFIVLQRTWGKTEMAFRMWHIPLENGPNVHPKGCIFADCGNKRVQDTSIAADNVHKNFL